MHRFLALVCSHESECTYAGEPEEQQQDPRSTKEPTRAGILLVSYSNLTRMYNKCNSPAEDRADGAAAAAGEAGNSKVSEKQARFPLKTPFVIGG